MDVKIVVDVDDTICTNIRRRPYNECVPVKPVIDTLNYLHDELGCKIALHTARGMVSCKGDMELIIKKNKSVLEEWLKENDVHYDELIFGKPIADLYVDDKALDVNDLRKCDFYRMVGGGSNKDLYRLGRFVKKDLGDGAERFKDWIEDNGGICKFPRIISYLYNEVTMEYIDGVNLCDSFTRADLHKVVSYVETFALRTKNVFDIGEHISVLEKNIGYDTTVDKIIADCKTGLVEHEKGFLRNASFCHGDMILSNIIKTENDLYFIDPQYARNASSYLLDYGKLRMSLMNYEKRFGISDADNSGYLQEFDLMMKHFGIYEEVILANLMYICRLTRYKQDKKAVRDMAEDFYGGVSFAR